uniref:Uncharacterized protein n=1 Tax=Populus trichocarpa TaxID=3694 RepID=A0A2K1R696_POPTR
MSRAEFIAREYPTSHFSPISMYMGLRGISFFAKSDWYLTSLSHLEIGYCPNLESLPDGVQSLSNLSWLTV